MYALFTIPDATTTISQASAYSSPWFTELLPVVYVSLGVFLGVAFVSFLISIFYDAFDNWRWSRMTDEEKRHHWDK